MSPEPFFSIIITTLNGSKVIRRALDSVQKSDYPRFEIIVVDNGSTDGLSDIVNKDYPQVRLIRSETNLGFAGGNNLGMEAARGDILVLLNDDTEVDPGWLSAWNEAIQTNPDWGILGAKLLYPGRKLIQHAGGEIEPNGCTHHLGYEQEDHGRFDEIRKCDYVTGAAIAIRRKLYQELGPLDENYFPIYFEEVDYCWQAGRIDREVLYVPGCVVIHHESRSQGRYSSRFFYRYHRGRLRFVTKCFSKRELWIASKRELVWLPTQRRLNFWLAYFRAVLVTLFSLPFQLSERKKLRKKLSHQTEK